MIGEYYMGITSFMEWANFLVVFSAILATIYKVSKSKYSLSDLPLYGYTCITGGLAYSLKLDFMLDSRIFWNVSIVAIGVILVSIDPKRDERDVPKIGSTKTK